MSQKLVPSFEKSVVTTLFAIPLLVGAAAWLQSCSLKQHPGEKNVSISIDHQALELLGKHQRGGSPLPSTINCFAVNIIASDISPTDPSWNIPNGYSSYVDVLNQANLSTAGTSSKICAYPGIRSVPITRSGGTVTLSVNTGTNRLFQLIAISDPANEVCNDSTSPVRVTSKKFARFQEIGRVVIDTLSDAAINLPIDTNYSNWSPWQSYFHYVDDCDIGEDDPLGSNSPYTKVLHLDSSKIKTVLASATGSLSAVPYATHWSDMSSSGIKFSASSNQPIVDFIGLNNRPAIKFDGSTNSFTTTLSTSTPLPSTLTVFTVFQSNSNSNSTVFGGSDQIGTQIFTPSNNGNSYFNISLVAGVPQGLFTTLSYSSSTATTLPASTATTKTSLGVFQIDSSNGHAVFSLNGSSPSTYGTATPFGATFLEIGATTTSTTTSSTSNYFNGEIGEILIYNSILGSTPFNSIQCHLAEKWGIFSMQNFITSNCP